MEGYKIHRDENANLDGLLNNSAVSLPEVTVTGNSTFK